MPSLGDLLQIVTGPARSAYQSWLDQGNQGTEADFVNALKGAAGATGPPFTVASPAAQSVTLSQAFQPRPDGPCMVIITGVLTGALQVSTITATCRPTANGSDYIQMPIVLSTTAGVSSNNIGAFLVPTGHYVRVTQTGISVLTNLTLTAYVWSL